MTNNFLLSDFSDPTKIDKVRKLALTNIFGNRIKISFLRTVLFNVQNKLGTEFIKYYPDSFKFTPESLLRGMDDVTFEYDASRIIVGIHRSNTMFLSDEERAKKQNSKEYIDEITRKVISHIKIRHYASRYARRFQFIAGDEFLFFPVAYKLFAMMMKSLDILNNGINSYIVGLYSIIINKGLSALTLLENNMFESVYPICRTIIETYTKLHALIGKEEAINLYNKLCKFELRPHFNISSDAEFASMFDSRKYKIERAKVNYLHFGWVDNLEDYHSSVTENKHYSFAGLCEYLDKALSKRENKECKNYNNLHLFYEYCHNYVHGTAGNQGWPIRHYLNISMILSLTIEQVYRMLCSEVGTSDKFDGYDIISDFTEDFELLKAKFNQGSPENCENYYQTFNCFAQKN